MKHTSISSFTKSQTLYFNRLETFITESVQLSECHNHTAVEFIDQIQTQCQIIIIISALMNGLLIIVLIGELFSDIVKHVNIKFFIIKVKVKLVNVTFWLPLLF